MRHTVFKKFGKTALAAASLLLMNAHAETGVVVFGDSLSDSGYFSPITQGRLGLTPSGKFTTNPDPVWGELLAQRLGGTLTPDIGYAGQTGNNFAVGGARAGVSFTQPTFGVPVPSVSEQVERYIARGVQAEALHVVWIGANDLFAAQESLSQGDTATAQSIIVTAAQSHATAIRRLGEAGVKTLLMPNLPDVGLTPMALAQGETVRQAASQAAAAYNALVQTYLKGSGVNVVALDMYQLLQEVAKTPAAYGISNMTTPACQTESSLLCTPATIVADASTYFFADGIHPSGAAHQMIADYAYETLTAPRQLGAVLPLIEKQGLVSRARVGEHLDALQLGMTTLPEASGVRLWANVGSGTGEAFGYDVEKSGLVQAGVDYKSPYLNGVVGVFLEKQDGDYEKNSHRLSTSSLGGGVYHATSMEKLGLNTQLQASFASLEVDSQRAVRLGNSQKVHEASADGMRYQLTAKLARPFDINKATLVPYADITASQLRVDALNESASATAITLDEQKMNSSHVRVGLSAVYPVNAVTLTADVHYQKQLSADTNALTASVRTLSDGVFSTSRPAVDEEAVGGSFGVYGTLGGADVGLRVSHLKSDDAKDTDVMASVGFRF
ncbi:MAG: SGNH/GDSL hydrolase family protein [Moraxella sp.]|nr:SGNH/GDSL hydrolase family protein [Moraxella sp.]